MNMPWRGTTEEISAEVESRYETPGGAQEKVNSASKVLDDRLQYFINQSGNSVAEIVDARVPAEGPAFDNMRKRLNDSDQKIKNVNAQLVTTAEQLTLKASKIDLTIALAPKADQSYVDTQFANIVSGSPKGTYTTLAALQAALPTGAEGTFLVLADGNWYFWDGSAWTSGGVYQSTGIADESINESKLSFPVVQGTKSKNLFNKDAVTPGHYVNASGGLTANAEYVASEHIKIVPNTTYTQALGLLVAFYDASRVFISSVQAATFTTPPGAIYMRMSSTTVGLSTQQLELGSVATFYESYGAKLTSSGLLNGAISTKKMSMNITDLLLLNEVGIRGSTITIKPFTFNNISFIVFFNAELGTYFFIQNAVELSFTVNSDFALVLNWDSTVTKGGGVASDFSVVNNTTVVNNPSVHILLRNGFGRLASRNSRIAAAIHQAENPVIPVTTSATVFPKINKNISDYASVFYPKWKMQNEDVTVLMMGDSILTTNKYTSDRVDAKNRPPLMTEMAYPTYTEEQLRWDGQTYFRYDNAGVFTETGTAETKEYDLAWDWVASTEAGMPALNNRPALTRILTGTNASVSYLIPVNHIRCDFIYRTDYLNATNAVVTINKGVGFVTVFDEATSNWVEANGYAYSAKESDTVITGTKGNLRKSMYQKRLKMRTTLANNDGTIRVTITNNGAGRLTYWGIQCGKNKFMIDFILAARGGHNIANLADFEAWDVDYWKPQLILWEIPLINGLPALANSDYTPKDIGGNTKDYFPGLALAKSLQIKAKTYSPELVCYPMWFNLQSNAIDDNNVWHYGRDVDGNQVSIPTVIRTLVGLLKSNNINVIPMFEYYLEHALREGAENGLSIRENTLVGSGKTGNTWTIDYAHFNDKGARITNEIMRPLFNC